MKEPRVFLQKLGEKLRKFKKNGYICSAYRPQRPDMGKREGCRHNGSVYSTLILDILKSGKFLWYSQE